MTTTMHAQDGGADGPALLHTGDVANCLMRLDLCSYAKARRRFYDEVNLNPFRKHPEDVMRLIEWSFEDWLAFDCSIVATLGGDGIGGTPDPMGGFGFGAGEMRFELDHGGRREHMRIHENGWSDPDHECLGQAGSGQGSAVGGGRSCAEPVAGISLYAAMVEFLGNRGRRELDTRAVSDLREVDATNFASMFWVRESNASTGHMTLEDLVHGGEYDVACAPLAAQYDGARGGMIVNRIAKVREAWRPCGIPVHEARRPDDAETREDLARLFRDGGWSPDFPALVRLFHGRSKDGDLGSVRMKTLMRRA